LRVALAAGHLPSINNQTFQQEATMGLDMYVFTTTTSLTQPVDFEGPEKIEEFHYWRKHPNLHG
jgi:hypothetical protein